MRLWIGSGISSLGGTMTPFAVMLQVYRATHSTLDVGLTGLASVLPGALFVLLGGSVGDRANRRKLALLATTGQMLVSAVLAVQALMAWSAFWLIYALLCAQSVLGVINAPARRTFVPRLLPKEQVRAGQTLNTLAIRFGEVARPSLAGVIASFAGLGWCYACDAATFLAALYAIYRLPPMLPEANAKQGGMLDGVMEGVLLGRWRALLGAMLADLSVTVLGVPTALLPALVSERFGGRPETLGLMMGATGIGGLVILALSGPVRHIRSEGKAILVACAAWAMAAGCLVGTGGPQLGNLRAGLVGSLLPPGAAIAVGGLSTLAAIFCVGWFVPELRRARGDGDF
ncbi:MFS transporter [Alicyclobacillus acidocaldarius]|uniref:Major facilitator superfamily MFS_1 n=1 Tax=Alicyclobacillus acidocaldarius (strain Tc-4-1) TaxID=1048834 RepID=F8IF02_ALIAT|nr:MFS transporter [Alicyclobacillus acidocaldarius]AEJ42785.1 major facilitator superfamily MFS_1 [Alicyclobacillus acidocaldarius subsp. acidocaldarius Tc-4-1]